MTTFDIGLTPAQVYYLELGNNHCGFIFEYFNAHGDN